MLQFSFGPFLPKGTKMKKRQHRFTKKIYFFLPSSHMGTYSQVGCHLPCLILGPLLGGGGDTSTISGDGGGISTTSGVNCLASSSLQKQETFS